MQYCCLGRQPRVTTGRIKNGHSTRAQPGFEASPFVRRFAPVIAAAAAGKPILDIAGGTGRNAIPLCLLGCSVVCVDQDLEGLQSSQARWRRRSSLREAMTRLTPYKLDLMTDTWPFPPATAGGIINVHFLCPGLFPMFEHSLSPGGYLLLETVSNRRGNYLELPRAGEIRAAFEHEFRIEWYRERSAGPAEQDAVTVQMLAKKRDE